MLIPGLVRRSRSTALGLCGATNGLYVAGIGAPGGVEIVPAAIVLRLYPQPAGPPLNGVLPA